FQQVEPVVDVPDRFPQVGGAVPALVGCRDRIARATGVPRAFGAGVDGQDTGVLAGELGGEEHQVGVDGEVYEGALVEEGFARVPVAHVLVFGVVDVLPGQGVLQLGGGDGDAVDEQSQVQRPALAVVPGGVTQLSG